MMAEGIEINTFIESFIDQRISDFKDWCRDYGSPEDIQRERAYEYSKGAIDFAVSVGACTAGKAVDLTKRAYAAFYR